MIPSVTRGVAMSYQHPPVYNRAPALKSGRPAVTVLSWISGICVLLGSALPLVSATGSQSLLASGDATLNVLIILILGLLVAGGTAAATRPAAAGLAGGAGLV